MAHPGSVGLVTVGYLREYVATLDAEYDRS
jgi:hypothetical protein